MCGARRDRQFTTTGTAPRAAPAAPTLAPSTGATTDELGDPLTTYEAVTNYNNYYEFGTDKREPAIRAKDFQVQPWTVQVGGLVNKPNTFGVEDLTRSSRRRSASTACAASRPGRW